ncbi:ABC multidrug efflux pump, inner membrane subunit [Candidatus Koribacter versatilis Ellin345]|uniref:ABC multidrug efflux pump, inner membrane subunit n=1 Tax=Koribacter versatilis (strain Ellin345) TaxID=204669 RepID=Q1IHS5_KORVE|nr:ABC transporter permease [Candidatus Koribacter versatilis]ABF43575.1 ABC multidrug efflux pump, inner membrane subunit [Candidatus Koribacter versatilis Ellin345]
MNRMWAIVEREMRKYRRSPTLMLVSMVMPLVQLIILGNAFGGKIREAKMGVVDQDRGTQSVRIREAFSAIQANVNTFHVVYYDNDQQAKDDVRKGKIQAAVVIPPEFSRKYYEENHPRIGVIVDNTDNFIAGSLEQKMQELVDALNKPAVQPRVQQQIALEVVELYPYIEYMKYLLPGSITLAMFISVMIGGGMLYIDDKARGVHEGYLVTPITRAELVFGLNIAGAIKAVISGVCLTVMGALIAGLSTAFHLTNILGALLMILATSMAFNTMMFLLMVRIEDPLVPRAMFGVLNTLLYFPSGAVYPIFSFPKWLRVIAYADPFSYAVDGFKMVLLKDAGFSAIWHDVAFLVIFSVITMAAAIPLFKRTL